MALTLKVNKYDYGLEQQRDGSRSQVNEAISPFMPILEWFPVRKQM